MKLLGLVLIIIAALTLPDCSPNGPTSLSIALVDSTGNPFIGATVRLNYINGGAQIGSIQRSDSNGKVFVANISAGEVNFDAYTYNGCMSNNYDSPKTSERGNHTINIISHQLNKTTATLMPIGWITLHNNSGDSYAVKLQGDNYFPLIDGYTILANDTWGYRAPRGTYNFSAWQTTGISGTPIKTTLQVALTCGGNIEINFPN
jgi:hypothetical protein